MVNTHNRLIELEAQMRVLHSRVIRLEAAASPAQAPAHAPVTAPPPPRPAPVSRPPQPVAQPLKEPARQRPAGVRPAPKPVDLEDLLGGRVLAWLGGLAVVLGLAFFFALAVSRGWIDETSRTLLAAAGSLAVLGTGIWLREKRGRTEAAMAAAATGLAGLFLTLVVAAQVYELIPPISALLLSLAVGIAGTALALRWNAPVVAAIGTLGAVLAPVLAGAPYDGTTIALLFVATAAGAATLVYRRWTWLAVALFGVATPQWAPWVANHASAAGDLLTLAGFGCAGLLAAVGFELRAGADRLRHPAAFLVAANSLVLGVAGWLGFHHAGESTGAMLWLAALALVHLAAGVSMRWEQRISRDLATLCVAIGVVFADVAWASFVDGPGVAIGWALSAIAFAWATSSRGLQRVERQAAAVGLGGQVAIALGHILVSDIRPTDLSSTAGLDAVFAVAALAAACLISGRFVEEGDDNMRSAIDGVGMAMVAYLTAATLDGAALTAAMAAEACVIAAVARARNDAVATAGAGAFLALAGLHALVVDVPPSAFLYGASGVGVVALATGAVVLAAARLGATLRLELPWPRALKAGAVVTALYGASVAIVTVFQPGAGVEPTAALELGVRQEGQMLVSGLWSAAGALALVAGLLRNDRDARLAGLALLIGAVGKVFLFDLATLASVYRVGSFVVLGLVLLAGAYAWQRLRPPPLPDLREV